VVFSYNFFLMEKIISYPLTFIFALFFLIVLVIFHPIQWIFFNIFGYQAHKKSVDYMNFFIIACTGILGTTFSFKNIEKVPKNVPVIFVSNHQSMYDIVGIIWFLRKFHPKFVSKMELGKGIPSVSYNLRHGGSVLIDRKDPKQALGAIKNLAKYIEKNKRAAVIFPEGTRSKNGEPKKFSENGIKTLCKYAPSAYIVPISINNSWKMLKFGKFPMGLGSKLEFIIHDAIQVKDHLIDEVLLNCEKAIIKDIKKS